MPSAPSHWYAIVFVFVFVSDLCFIFAFVSVFVFVYTSSVSIGLRLGMVDFRIMPLSLVRGWVCLCLCFVLLPFCCALLEGGVLHWGHRSAGDWLKIQWQGTSLIYRTLASLAGPHASLLLPLCLMLGRPFCLTARLPRLLAHMPLSCLAC